MTLKMMILMLQMFYRKGGYIIRDKFEESFVNELKRNIDENLPKCPRCGSELYIEENETSTDYSKIVCICLDSNCFKANNSKTSKYKYVTEEDALININ